MLVWKFPEPRDPVLIPLGSDLGSNAVQVKLSDYGISQFVATQGARGMVGTPGFMAPEILKYHGKEVSMYMCVCVYMHVCVYMRKYACVRMYVCMCILKDVHYIFSLLPSPPLPSPPLPSLSSPPLPPLPSPPS